MLVELRCRVGLSFRKVPNLVKVLCWLTRLFVSSFYEAELTSFSVQTAVEEVVDRELHGVFRRVHDPFLVRAYHVDSPVKRSRFDERPLQRRAPNRVGHRGVESRPDATCALSWPHRDQLDGVLAP